MQEKPHWKDDDFFIRLGFFKPVNDTLKPSFESLLNRLRDFLCIRGPVTVDVPIDAISIVYYDNPSLDRLKNGDPKNEIPLRRAISHPSLVYDLYVRWKNDH
jgi:hypothetical protein